MGQSKATYDVIIIGAGPAGLTAALYAGRGMLNTLVLEQAIPGGQLNETDLIENWPGYAEAISAPELMSQLRKQVERFGAEIVQDEVTRVEPGDRLHRVITPRTSYEARAIIAAPGSRPRELPATGADRLKGKGVAYCATCDGFFFQGKRLIQVGAGDSGLTESLFLTKFAETISVVVRHPEDDPKAFRASPILQERARNHPKIDFLWDCVIDEVLGDDRLTGVRLRNLSSDQTCEVDVDGVFVNIGHIPQTDFLRGVVTLDDGGYIVTDKYLQTDIPGILAAGDARIDASRYAQAVVAAGEGAMAALGVLTYLET